MNVWGFHWLWQWGDAIPLSSGVGFRCACRYSTTYWHVTAPIIWYKGLWQHSKPGHCITNVIATCRKNFSQWESSFLWKLRYHWLKVLRRVAKTLVIQGPDTLVICGSSCACVSMHWANSLETFSRYLIFADGNNGPHWPSAAKYVLMLSVSVHLHKSSVICNTPFK